MSYIPTTVKNGDTGTLSNPYPIRSLYVVNPTDFWINFPEIQGAYCPPKTTGATFTTLGSTTVKYNTTTPSGLSSNSSGQGIAVILATDENLQPSPGSPLPAASPLLLWDAISSLGQWTSASGQPLPFANPSTSAGIGLLIFRPSGGTGDFSIHCTGSVSNFDYFSQAGVPSTQTGVLATIVTAPITPVDNNLTFTWTDTGGFSYDLFAISGPVDILDRASRVLGTVGIVLSQGSTGQQGTWTKTVVAVPNSGTATLLASNSNRRGVVIDANQGSGVIGVGLDTSNAWVFLPVNGYWEMPSPIYTGQISILTTAVGQGGNIIAYELT